MKKIIFLALLSGFGILTGCYYDKEEELYPNLTTNTDCNKQLTYNTGIKTIIDINCATSSCHGAGGTSPDLSNFQLVVSNATGITERAITEKNMPAPSGMSSCNIIKLDNWIKAGMPQ